MLEIAVGTTTLFIIQLSRWIIVPYTKGFNIHILNIDANLCRKQIRQPS